MMELETLNGTITIELSEVTLQKLNDIISILSVEGPSGANTILYSGNIGGISSNVIIKDMEEVRIIDNTSVGKFLSNTDASSKYQQLLKNAIYNEIKQGTFDKSLVINGIKEKHLSRFNDLYYLSKNVDNMTSAELLELVELASIGYTYEPTQGAWAIASKRFIEETPTDSEIICITAEANNTRTWAAVEVPTALDKLPDEQKFGGYTIGELKQIRDSEGIEKVVDILKQESAEITDDIQLYYDKNGTLITTDSSSITGGNAVEIPKETAFSTSMSDIRNYADSKYMSSICPEYELLSDLQKLQLQQIELDARNHNFTKLQQTISSDATGSVGNVKIVYDVEGNVTGIDMSGIRQGSAISTEGSSAVFDISSDGSTTRENVRRNVFTFKRVNYAINLVA